VIELPSGELFSFRIKGINATLNGAGVAAPLTYTLNISADGDINFYIPETKSYLLRNAGVLDGKVSSYHAFTGNQSEETTNYWKALTQEQKTTMLGW
jgi:hypothetical protein